MNHVFSVPVTIRGYECRQGAVVGLPQVLSLLEHCRWEWILAPSLGLVEALHEGHFFVVHRATVGLCRTFGIGTELSVRAVLRKVGRVNCYVEQDLVRADGVRLARAFINAIWIGPDGRMKRVPEPVRHAPTDLVLAATEDAPLGSGVPGSFLDPPEQRFAVTLDETVYTEVPEHATRSSIVVRPSDCDLHDHVNNANYLRYFEDALGAPAREGTVEYRGQATQGDRLTLAQWPVGEGRCAFVLHRGDDVMARAVVVTRPAAP